LRLQIENDRALVAVVVQERRGKPGPAIAAGARGVTPVGGLDLDDVGALVGENHRGERPGDI
jgi:hypothetical protein